MSAQISPRLCAIRADLERFLRNNAIETPPTFQVPEISCKTHMVAMRDGTLLATDIYASPLDKAPVIAMRTPYGRASDGFVSLFLSFARRGYVIVSQDCRGTGGSEPDSWDYYVYEQEDSYDLVAWIAEQPWHGGFIGSIGGSYIGQTQWCMATHPSMSAIAPQVSGLGFATNSARLHLYLDAYARAVGKGAGRTATHHTQMEAAVVHETLASGYFNEPLVPAFSPALVERYPAVAGMAPQEARCRLWQLYCASPPAERAQFVKEALGADAVTILEIEKLATLLGQHRSHDAHTLPRETGAEVCEAMKAPALVLTGWYDWGLNDALLTWSTLRRLGRSSVATRSRLIIDPRAHARPGYVEGVEHHPELIQASRFNVEMLLDWFRSVRDDDLSRWPHVIYYLMGANEWRVSEDWPVPGTREQRLYLGPAGTLSTNAPASPAEPDQFRYDPEDPTPTVGGSIVSYLYPAGSVDVSIAQSRPDVLVYSTEPLDEDLDVVGPLRLHLYASSSAVDTDFVARLSDVFPDGRALQIQNGILRVRWRDLPDEPRLIEPGQVYLFEIDMWATANRFKAGHRLRLDISSADFPRFDRNTNRGGEPGLPIKAVQSVYRDRERPSFLQLSVLAGDAAPAAAGQRRGRVASGRAART